MRINIQDMNLSLNESNYPLGSCKFSMSSFYLNVSQIKVKSLYDKLMIFLVGEFAIVLEYIAKNHIACVREMWMN